jgi:hypothetical protein
VRALLFREEKHTGKLSLKPTFWITWLWPNEVDIKLYFTVTPSEQKNLQDNLPALAYFQKNFTLKCPIRSTPSN